MSSKIKVRLVIACVECQLTTEAPYDNGDRINTSQLFLERGWFISVVDKRENEVVMAPLCGGCAVKVYPPELLAAAKKHLSAS